MCRQKNWEMAKGNQYFYFRTLTVQHTTEAFLVATHLYFKTLQTF